MIDPAAVINDIAKGINEWAIGKGFWDFGDVPPNHPLVKTTKLMLVVTELAEGVEGIRKPVDSRIVGFTNEEEEVADAMIRLLDYAAQYDLRLGEAIFAKMAYNEGRPFRHGKGF